MSDMFKLAQATLAAQPFSKLLGAELPVFGDGQAHIVVPLRPDLLQQHGFAHGGVVSYAADNAITFAAGTMLGNSVTAEYKINYVRPAIGEKLIARAQIINVSKRQAVCRCDVFVLKEGEEKLCATAMGSVTKVTSSKTD